MATTPVTRGAAGERAAQNIERFRKARGLNQKDVADRLKAAGRPMLPSVISKIERGDRRIDVDDLFAIADVLEVSPLALVQLEQWETLEQVLNTLLIFIAENGDLDYGLFGHALGVLVGMRMITPEHAETATRVHSAIRKQGAAKRREVTDATEWLTRDLPRIQQNILRRIEDPGISEGERAELRMRYSANKTELAETREVLGADETA